MGLTPEEQHKKEEDPDFTLIELLGLTPCEGHFTTPLQTLDGILSISQVDFFPWHRKPRNWPRQWSRQWSGIPIEKLLNQLFTEQLNYIQALLHSAREHLTYFTLIQILIDQIHNSHLTPQW